jgi:alkylation response protein AidB-like acyl-CoA dehydrogenase
MMRFDLSPEQQQLYEGTSQVQRIVIARNLLKG